MGPVRGREEPLSSFRFRYASFCLAWLIPLGLGTLLLLAASPDVSTSAWPFAIMFLYIGLPIGAGMALVATVSFAMSGLWAQIAESSVESERLLNRIKVTAAALMLTPIFGLCLFFSVQGLLSGKVQAFSKNLKLLILRVEQPGWFYLNVAIWAVAGIWGAYFVVRNLRSVYSA